MIVAVASGKGGTGKTTVATSLALALVNETPLLFLDCDVEAPNAHLFLKPVYEQRAEAAVPVPHVDARLCQLHGVCSQVCQYHAIALVGGQVRVFPELCHGCGSCTLNCPERAIREVPHVVGTVESGRTAEGIRFARGVLRIGQPMAVPVIRQLRRAHPVRPGETAILDAPPGTSCPVVATILGADYVLLVTEPTPFGLHDLKLAYELTRDLCLPAGVVVNRDGIGDASVDAFCAEVGLPVLLRIPMDRAIAAGVAQGTPLIRLRPDYAPRFRQLFAAMAGQVEARA